MTGDGWDTTASKRYLRRARQLTRSIAAAVASVTAVLNRYVLPNPSRNRGAVEATCESLSVEDSNIRGSLQDSILNADATGRFLVVIGHSELHPDSAAFLRDVEDRRDLFNVPEVANRAVFVVMSVTQTPSLALPTALRTATTLPAVAVYKVETRSGTISLVSLAEGFTRATSLRILVDECVERFGPAPDTAAAPTTTSQT